MTDKARVVLQDLKTAIRLHGDHLDGEAFRISWFAVVGLLRAVGHVLSKVDVNASPAIKRAIDAKWKDLQRSKPEPLIFWGFIEGERNRFLKNYEHGITRQLMIKLPVESGYLSLDLANSRGGFTQLLGVHQLPHPVEDRARVSFISDGPFAGRSEREVAWEAYQWWESYLNEVDELARRNQAV